MARQKKVRDDSEYSFMDTYGDLVTLVLTFFVLLFSFSSLDAKKFEMLKEALNNSGPSIVISAMDATDLVGMSGKMSTPTFKRKDKPDTNEIGKEELKNTYGSGKGSDVEKKFDGLYDKIQSYINANHLGDALFVERDGDVIMIRVTSKLLFDSGDAALLPDAVAILDDVGAMFKASLDSIQLIRVEGHTDNRPIHTSKFEDNWDLSAKRATNTVRALNKSHDIPMEVLSAMGYGEYDPIDTNDTEEGRMRNRRVTFVIEKKNGAE